MLSNLLFWLPDEAAVLVIAGIGLALMVGVINLGAAFRYLGLVCLLLVLSPFVGSLLNLIPTIWLVPIVVMVALSMARSLATMLIGRGATEHMVGSLAASVVRGVFVCMFLPFRMGFALLRWSFFGPRY